MFSCVAAGKGCLMPRLIYVCAYSFSFYSEKEKQSFNQIVMSGLGSSNSNQRMVL